ncbi:MAG: AraC family transcriptional regulator [Deltaproteobacteria bacterium]|nr:AraC family transcriptional regulator [Deltaproteobacteria bacterium]
MVLDDLIRAVSTVSGGRYERLICLILQGAKEPAVGERAHVVGPGQCLVVSHALPATARVTVASPEGPTSPLQSQKSLRVNEARRLPRAGDHSVSMRRSPWATRARPSSAGNAPEASAVRPVPTSSRPARRG